MEHTYLHSMKSLGSAVRRLSLLSAAVLLGACADKAFVGSPEGTGGRLGIVVGIGEFAQATGVRIQVSYQVGDVRGSLYDEVIPYALEVPTRDFTVPLNIAACLAELRQQSQPDTACPITVIVDILDGTRVLARDQLPPISVSAGQTVTTAALGARTASTLRLTRNGTAVPATIGLQVGDNATIVSDVLDAAGVPIAGRTVTWSSSATSVATVTPGGLVAAVGSGNATITASTGTGAALLQQTFIVQVNPRPAVTLTVTPNPAGVAINATTALTVVARDAVGGIVATPPLTWESSATNVATVSGDGLVTGVAFGTATITARAAGGLSGSTTVNVGQPATLTLTPNPASVAVNGTQVITVTARDAGNTIVPTPTLTFESSNTTLATVTNGGVVTGLAPGSVVITARAAGNLSGQTTVNVTAGARVYGQVRNALTNVAIAGATVRLTGGNQQTRTTTSAANGTYSFDGVLPATYLVEVLQTGFTTQQAQNVQVLAVTGGDVQRLDFDLPSTNSTQRFSGISGKVRRGDGTPIVDAEVTLSGGVQTNGVFRATRTATDGSYTFPGIVLDDVEGFPIEQFTVAATAVGFGTASRVVSLVQNRVIPNQDIALAVAGPITTFFTDGFETQTAWVSTGTNNFWNRSTLVGSTNNAYPTFVSKAPDDNSNGALPAPLGGSFAFWFGQFQTGNYRGTPAAGDLAGSGGTSAASSIAGILTSPLINIPANATRATLRFDTWFEIESVNPNNEGYDIMDVSIKVGNVTTSLGKLNPFSDPTVSPRFAIPYTSGGFNRAPVWRPVEINLSAYRGQQVQLLFSFNTVDDLYNGFRGWIIDNVTVSDRPMSQAATLPMSQSRVSQPTPTRTRRGR